MIKQCYKKVMVSAEKMHGLTFSNEEVSVAFSMFSSSMEYELFGDQGGYPWHEDPYITREGCSTLDKLHYDVPLELFYQLDGWLS